MTWVDGVVRMGNKRTWHTASSVRSSVISLPLECLPRPSDRRNGSSRCDVNKRCNAAWLMFMIMRNASRQTCTESVLGSTNVYSATKFFFRKPLEVRRTGEAVLTMEETTRRCSVHPRPHTETCNCSSASSGTLLRQTQDAAWPGMSNGGVSCRTVDV